MEEERVFEEAKICDTARELRLEYFRKWRAANKDKVRQHNKNYWLKKAIRNLSENNKTKED